jgi:LacI family transcriptional regulator
LTESLLRAISTERSPVGVFACNDEMALVVYRAAAQLGRRIPEDIGVIGFNDEARAATAQPPLTSVRQPLQAMAARAVELITELRRHDESSYQRVELPCELVVRSSTLPAARLSSAKAAEDGS